MKDVLTFLSDCYDCCLQYRSINVLRSTISAIHLKIDGFSVGQHPYGINILKGILNLRPPKPQYSMTWNVSKVTSYLANMGSYADITLKQLSWKLATIERFSIVLYFVHQICCRLCNTSILQYMNYLDALKLLNIRSMKDHHEYLCDTLFQSVMSDENHKIRHLLPERYDPGYPLRNINNFNLPLIKTERTKNSFIFAMCNKFNKIK